MEYNTIYPSLFAQAYGSSTYNGGLYSAQTTTSAGSSSSSSSGGVLVDTGFIVAVVVTLAAVIIVVALIVRIIKRPKKGRVTDRPAPPKDTPPSRVSG